MSIRETEVNKLNVIDAEWTPAGEHDPKAYSCRCRRIQGTKRHRKIAYAQRLLVGAALILVMAAVLRLVVL